MAQELSATVTIQSNKVDNQVDPKIFIQLQTQLRDFINQRKWALDAFGNEEKIECSFFITIESVLSPGVYDAKLSILSSRPVFNANYTTPVLNMQDPNFTFKYQLSQPIEFNENKVQGADPLEANLTATIAFYINIILGLDYDSFSLKGGAPYFNKALNIVYNAPEAAGINGWKSFDGQRNRYWLVENMLNSRYSLMHDVYYNYYRLGMDKLYENENAARAELLNVLNLLNTFATENPNKMISQFFFQGKSTELIKIFSKALPPDKARASELLQKLDLTNAAKYQAELK